MLDFINQAIELLSRPPGDLVYYLIVLFAIEAMLGLAVVRARRSGWTRQLRLILLASSVMLIGYAALVIIALLSLQGTGPDLLLADAIQPPLQRHRSAQSDIPGAGFCAAAARSRSTGLGPRRHYAGSRHHLLCSQRDAVVQPLSRAQSIIQCHAASHDLASLVDGRRGVGCAGRVVEA
jgi:hypothetical protein